jgi:DNA primase
MRFTREFIKLLKDKTDLKELVSEYTELQKAGPYLYMAHCPHPSHNDSDASFRLYADVQTWSCFGCHCDKKDKSN